MSWKLTGKVIAREKRTMTTNLHISFYGQQTRITVLQFEYRILWAWFEKVDKIKVDWSILFPSKIRSSHGLQDKNSPVKISAKIYHLLEQVSNRVTIGGPDNDEEARKEEKENPIKP